jgi:hypothetical protein
MSKRKIALVSASVLGAATGLLVLSPDARAFSLSGLAGVFDSFAPVLSEVFNVDLSPYVQKVNSAAGIADSLQGGDYLQAAQGLGGAIGEFGGVDLTKYRANLLANSTFSTTKDFGIGLYGNNYLTESAGMESLSKIQSDANNSESAQQAATTKIDGVGKTIGSLGEQAQKAQNANNSLTVLKTIPAGLAGVGVLLGQNITATMDVAQSSKRNEVLLGEIMANQLQTTRSKIREGEGGSLQHSRNSGLFLGVFGGKHDKSRVIGGDSSSDDSVYTGPTTTQLPDAVTNPQTSGGDFGFSTLSTDQLEDSSLW